MTSKLMGRDYFASFFFGLNPNIPITAKINVVKLIPAPNLKLDDSYLNSTTLAPAGISTDLKQPLVLCIAVSFPFM